MRVRAERVQHPWHVVAALAGVLAMAALACAQPGTEEALARVNELTARLAAVPAPPASERAALLDESIAARAALIATATNEQRLPTWLLDQADALLQQAGRDGSEWSALYGVPTGSQRVRTRDGAAQASALIERAGRAIAETVERLEGELFAARGDAARAARVSEAIEPRLRVLLDVEQAWRVPMLGARSELLTIATTEGAARSMARRKRASEIAGLLDDLPAPDLVADLSRTLLEGAAHLLAGSLAPAGDQFREAETLAGDEAAREQARLGRTAAATNLESARELSRRLLESSEDVPLLLALVRAETAARAVLLQAPGAGPERAPVQREALAGMTGVVRRVIRDHGAVPQPMRELVMQKVAVLTGAGTAWGQVEAAAMDPALMYARGMTLVGAAEGTALLRSVVESRGEPDVRAAAMWALGTRAGASERAGMDAAGMLVRLAREFPASERAPTALARADALLRGLMASRRADVLKLQRELIELSSAGDLSALNRNELASLALANHALDEEQVVDGALLERILGSLTPWPEEQGDRRAADERNASIVVDRALARTKDATGRAALARAGAEWAAERGSALAARYRLAWAEALLETGDAKGSEAKVMAIGPLGDAALSDGERVRARLTLGRAQRRAGDNAAAFTTFRALTDDLDVDDPGRSRRVPAFWAAWADMLEILESQNTEGDRTPTIRLHVNRLRLIDPDMGGEPWKGRIGRVEASLK